MKLQIPITILITAIIILGGLFTYNYYQNQKQYYYDLGVEHGGLYIINSISENSAIPYIDNSTLNWISFTDYYSLNSWSIEK